MSDIALTVSVLALVAVVGLWLGNIKIRGVGFGIGGVLFGGIFVGHFADQLGWVLSADMLHFIQEFGLILFVYTIVFRWGRASSLPCASPVYALISLPSASS